ncbi:hypothetical protein [Caballeronia novacaledonica]|uniref:Uncharacterized protein n=1 Tax=Caballeronia novacaledonica TaxID=1544861 RepID=A0AA37IG80_9BURK|nr:hypothetical protein [Caballeronia novacaledonica]GJH29102.1 hypothetical protein CBA19CS42_31320 [Caballeronia novacaledonica]
MNAPVKPTHIYIATPSYGGSATTCYINGLLDLVNSRFHSGITFTVGFNNFESLITRARNVMVANFLANEEFTHLMWIDSDIGFTAADVLRLVRADRLVAAGVYPKKTEGWPQGGLEAALPAGTRHSDFRARYSRFPVSARVAADAPDADGFLEVVDAPTGFMLIKREVFVALMRHFPDLRYTPYESDLGVTATRGATDFHYAFFDTMIDPETGFYLSEDYAFCRRVARIGVRPVIDTRSSLIHQGSVKFEGSFGRWFESRRNEAGHNTPG